MTRLTQIFTPATVTLALTFFFLLATSAFAAPNALPHSVEWEQSKVSISMLSGTSDLVEVRFYSDADLGSESVWVTPSLEKFIIEKQIVALGEEQYLLSLILSIPEDNPTSTYGGTLHLSDDKKTLSKPMNITVNVVDSDNETIPDVLSNPSPDRYVSDAEITIVKGELFVGLDLEVDDPQEQIIRIAKETGGVFLGSHPGSGLYQLRFDVTDIEELYEIADRVSGYREVEFAVPNHITENPFLQTHPNDPKYLGNFTDLNSAIQAEWDENNPDGINWYHEVMRMPSAWSIETGDRNIKVGIIDVAVDGGASDIAPNFDRHKLANMQFWLSGFVGSEHGTQVAGSVCARGNNSIGIAGTSWQCGITSYAAWSSKTIGGINWNWGGAYDSMIDAVDDGMEIVNISLGAIGESGVPKIPTTSEKQKANDINSLLSRAVIYGKAQGKDILWVVAAGNSTMDARYEAPAGLSLLHPDNVLTVAATDEVGHLASFSNFGDAVDVAAPGVDIATVNPNAQSGYSLGSGTSFSAPLVTGIATLLKSYDSNISAQKMKRLIVEGSEKGGNRVNGQNFSSVNAKDSLCLLSPSHNVCQLPLLQNIQVSNITSTGVQVTWQTDEPATSIVQYGRIQGLPNYLLTSDSYVTNHFSSLSNLQPDTTYYFRVVSKDPNGNKSESTFSSFRTLPVAGVNRPPVLALPTSGLYTSGFSPSNPDSNTQITYQIMYSDQDNDWPREMSLNIEGVTDEGGTYTGTFDCSGNDHFNYLQPRPYFSEVDYCIVGTTFAPGNYGFWFEASDGLHAVRYPAVGSLPIRVDQGFGWVWTNN